MKEKTGRRFRVSLSFAGQQRNFVRAVAAELAKTLGREGLLFDEFYEAEFARPGLDVYLPNLYHEQAELVVVFISKDYDGSEWCGLEWRTVRDLIKRREAASIMLLRFDDQMLPGILSIDGYADIAGRRPAEVASLILQRLEPGRRGERPSGARPRLEATVLESRSPIVIAVEAEDEPISEGLLRAERHMTIRLQAEQLCELERIAASLGGARRLDEMMRAGASAWDLLERSAERDLADLFEHVRRAEQSPPAPPQPIAWAGKAQLLLRVYKAILVATPAPGEDLGALLSVGYGAHFFHPLDEGGRPRTMRRRAGRLDRSRLQVEAREFGDEETTTDAVLPALDRAVAAEVVAVAAPRLDRLFEQLIERVERSANSRTRLALGFGAIELTPSSLHRALATVPAVALGSAGLLRAGVLDALRALAPALLPAQAAPAVLARVRKETLERASRDGDIALLRDAIAWGVFSWVALPLFTSKFDEVRGACYPHLMDLRQLTSRERYVDRSKDIPERYWAQNLVKPGDDPENRFHLYLSGAGGTGKSCFLRYLHDSLWVNQRDVLPVWYKVDAPSSQWESVERRLKEELRLALSRRLGPGAIELPSDDQDLGFYLKGVVEELRRRSSGIRELVLFIDQLERTFESGDNPEFHRLEQISKRCLELLDTVRCGEGVRVYIASRKQYLPDFLSSFESASRYQLHFNVLQKITDDTEREAFVEQILGWCKKKGLVDKGLRFERQAAKKLASTLDGHPLNMALSLIHVFSQVGAGEISGRRLEELKPQEHLFAVDESLAAKDDIDWYFLLAMAHARTEIVRFEEVFWRLRLVKPELTARVDLLGPLGVLERLWMLGHLGRTIHARPLGDNPARFVEFFHANLRDHLISTVMNYGGAELELRGGKAGTPPVWRALDRLIAAAKEWGQSQQLLARDDVSVLMEHRHVLVEQVATDDGADRESFYLLFLRDSPERRSGLFEAAKECLVYSALVHDRLGRWLFGRLFPDVDRRVAIIKRWLLRCERDNRVPLLRYLIELRTDRANEALAGLVFDRGDGEARDAWRQLGAVLSAPLLAERYRGQILVALLSHVLVAQPSFPSDGWHADRFGLFVVASCGGDRDEFLALLKQLADRVAALQSARLQRAVAALLGAKERLDAWLRTAESSGVGLPVLPRGPEGQTPRIELRAGEVLASAIGEEHLRHWHAEAEEALGVPLPALSRTTGELIGQERETRGCGLALLIDGRLVALGEFYPDRLKTRRRHFQLDGREVPRGALASHDESTDEAAVWVEPTELAALEWQREALVWDRALAAWLQGLLRRYVDAVFSHYDVVDFLHGVLATEDPRLKRHDFLRTISGNLWPLWRVLVSLVREEVPVHRRRVELMLELSEQLRESRQVNAAVLTRQLRLRVKDDLCKALANDDNELPVMLFEEKIEQQLQARLELVQDSPRLALNVDEALLLAATIRGYFEQVLRTEDAAPVLACEEALRMPLSQLLLRFDARIRVVGYSELSTEVRLSGKGVIPGVALGPAAARADA